MKPAPHKIVAYFMLCIIALPLLFSVHVLVSEAIIYHQVMEDLERKNLVTIHVKSSEVVWTEKGKEARVDKKMFDIKNYSVSGDEIQLTGLFDTKEDALFAQINYSQQSDNHDLSGSTLVLKWFSCFTWNTHLVNNAILFSEKKSAIAFQQNNFFQNIILSCDTPPPKFSLT